MSEEPTGRDIRIMWKTVVTVAVVVAACIGGIVVGVTEWVRMVTRVEAVEKWQAQKDRDASRELWRRREEAQKWRLDDDKTFSAALGALCIVCIAVAVVALFVWGVPR